MLNSLFHPPPDGGKSVTACLGKYSDTWIYKEESLEKEKKDWKMQPEPTRKYI